MSYIHKKLKQFSYPFTSRIIIRAAKKLGLEVEIIDKKFFYFFIIKKGRREEHFINNMLPLNSMVAHRVARDKVYSYMVLERNGINIPEGNYFFCRNFRSNLEVIKDQGRKEALVYAEKIGYPAVIKANDLSLGQEVYLVKSRKDLNAKLSHFFSKDYIAIVQKPVYGREYRLVVLDGKIYIAYEKISKKFCKNLSKGARAVDVTSSVHPFYSKLAKKMFNLLKLRVGGIDIVVEDITKPDKNYSVLEVNSMIGLEKFYEHGGKQRVERFYGEVLKRLFSIGKQENR